MKKMLITGGTVFVSQHAARYFAGRYDVYVLNRNTRPQCGGVTLIEGDRHCLGEKLRQHHFDAVLDITAYDADDVNDLLDALGSFGDYILLSSSAVYPETGQQPFPEESKTGPNQFWGKYGTDKIGAENALRERVPNGYILRPPYLYGPGNNVYRESFVFDCALQGRPFYLPGKGEMNLQFLHVEDLCRLILAILQTHPEQRIFNAGNGNVITVKEWVTMCYQAVGKTPVFLSIPETVEQRKYFPFYPYEYRLSVDRQFSLIPDTKPMEIGIQESLAWYLCNHKSVVRKPFFDYIDLNLK